MALRNIADAGEEEEEELTALTSGKFDPLRHVAGSHDRSKVFLLE